MANKIEFIWKSDNMFENIFSLIFVKKKRKKKLVLVMNNSRIRCKGCQNIEEHLVGEIDEQK